jgi:hypothetical protein
MEQENPSSQDSIPSEGVNQEQQQEPLHLEATQPDTSQAVVCSSPLPRPRPPVDIGGNYDVLVACALENDAQGRQILAPLERSGPEGLRRDGLRVCYPARDFPPTARRVSHIKESIEAAIMASKRVVCLVSHEFLRSKFCMKIWRRALQLHREPVIAVKWPDVDPGSAARISVGRLDVRKILTTHTYIELGSTRWMERLLRQVDGRRL